jgi:hypothetical protein
MSSTPHTAVAADSLIATPAFDRWFSKLRRSDLAELPTPRRVGMNLLRAGGAGLLAFLLYFQLRDAEGLVFVAAGVVGFVGSALACVRLVLRAIWQTIVLVTRRSRWREPGSGWDGILERILGAGELGGQISFKSIDDLIGSAFEFLLELALKPWAMRRKRKQQARFAELARQVADDGEQVLAAWPATMNRRSLASILLLNFNRRSVLVVLTDARLRCVRLRRQRELRDTSMDVPLSALRVREWYLGLPPYDVVGPVLWLADRLVTSRLASPWIWREEATLAFNVVYAAQLAREQPA